MKISFILAYTTLLICCTNTQDKYFMIQKKGPSSILTLKELIDENGIYSFYKKINNYDSSKKIEMIDELLSYCQNSNKSSLVITSSNKNLSQMYNGTVKHSTVQIDALILINQLYFDNPFYYSPYPIIIDTQRSIELNSDEDAMKEVCSIYNQWFKKVKKIGFDNAKDQNLVPFSKDSGYKWLYGINISPNDNLQFELDEIHQVLDKIEN